MYGHTCVHDLQIWLNQSESQDGSKSHSFTFYSSPLKFFIAVLITHILRISRIKSRTVHHPSPLLSLSTRRPCFSSNSPPIWPPCGPPFHQVYRHEPLRVAPSLTCGAYHRKKRPTACVRKDERASRWVLPDTSGEREAAEERPSRSNLFPVRR